MSFLLISTAGFCQSVKPDPGKHPVCNHFLKGIQDFNQHNLQNFSDQFAEDINMYTHSGWLRSKQQVRARFPDIFSQFPNIYMEPDSLNVRQVNKNTVVADFRCRTRIPEKKVVKVRVLMILFRNNSITSSRSLISPLSFAAKHRIQKPKKESAITNLSFFSPVFIIQTGEAALP